MTIIYSAEEKKAYLTRIKSMVEKGMSDKEIGSKLGIRPGNICSWRQDAKIPSGASIAHAKERDKLIQAWNKNKSVDDVCEAFSCSKLKARDKIKYAIRRGYIEPNADLFKPRPYRVGLSTKHKGPTEAREPKLTEVEKSRDTLNRLMAAKKNRVAELQNLNF